MERTGNRSQKKTSFSVFKFEFQIIVQLPVYYSAENYGDYTPGFSKKW